MVNLIHIKYIFFTNYTSNRHTKSYSLLSCWQTGKGITQNRSSKKLIQEYLGEKYIKKRWEEKQQQLLHYQTVIFLDPKWSNPPMCAGRTKGRIRTDRLKDTIGEPQVPKSCWQKLPLAFWDLFWCVFILLFTSSLLVEAQGHSNFTFSSHSWGKPFRCDGLSWKTIISWPT